MCMIWKPKRNTLFKFHQYSVDMKESEPNSIEQSDFSIDTLMETITINDHTTEKDPEYREESLYKEILFPVYDNKDGELATLSINLLSDEKYFTQLFSFFSQGACFKSLLPCIDTDRVKVILLSEWLNPYDYFSAFEFITAIFEQVIIIKYVIFCSDSKEREYMLTNTSFYSQIYSKSDIYCFFLQSNFSNKDEVNY